MTGFDDTICALATGSCNGAISVIRISGKDCFRIVDAVVSFAKGSVSESNGGCVKYGMIEGIDEVLVSIFRAPRSYTGEDSAEISCHASRVIVDRILALLVEKGARSAMPGEFSKRAFLNGKLDLSQAEAVADLIAASSEASARVALNQLKGKYSSELRNLRRSLLEISSLLELELDFSEEDVEFADRKKLTGLVESVIERVDGLASTFKQGNAIKSGVNVAIAGPVNSGKSTLLNALLGEERAIVSDVPGTTRDTVEEVLELSGVLYRFTDTAGIRESRDKVERMGIERTMDKLGTADTVIAVIDGSSPIEEVRRSFPSLIEKVSDAQRLIVVRNKVDIFDAFAPEEFPRVDRFYGVLELKYPAFGTYMYSPEQLAEELGFKADASMEKGSGPESVPNGRRYGIIDISAKTGEGLDELRRCITDGRTEIDANAVLVTNQRHYEALLRSSEALHRVRTDLETSLTPDLLSEDLRIAINELSSIFGEITSDEVLGSIFERFCIGK